MTHKHEFRHYKTEVDSLNPLVIGGGCKISKPEYFGFVCECGAYKFVKADFVKTQGLSVRPLHGLRKGEDTE